MNASRGGFFSLKLMSSVVACTLVILASANARTAIAASPHAAAHAGGTYLPTPSATDWENIVTKECSVGYDYFSSFNPENPAEYQTVIQTSGFSLHSYYIAAGAVHKWLDAGAIPSLCTNLTDTVPADTVYGVPLEARSCSRWQCYYVFGIANPTGGGSDSRYSSYTVKKLNLGDSVVPKIENGTLAAPTTTARTLPDTTRPPADDTTTKALADVPSPIGGAFTDADRLADIRNQIDQQGDALARAQLEHEEALRRQAECESGVVDQNSWSCAGAGVYAAFTERQLREEQARLEALQQQARSLSSDVGTIASPCVSGQPCPGYDYVGPDLTAPSGCTANPTADGCPCPAGQTGGTYPNCRAPSSTFSGPTTTYTQSSSYGYTQSPYASTQPPPGSQQCTGLQQMMSTCRNPYTGQQQCTGIALMTNNCPAGSYNPNNPNNPYNYPQPTCTVQANPANITAPGQPVTLTWQSQYAQYASLSSSGQVGPSGTMTVYPQNSTSYILNMTGYAPALQGRCQTQVSVGNQAGNQPQATISCTPQTADVGTPVNISFSCANAAASSGSGFSTGNALSGSATTTVSALPAGQNTITYGLTCSNQGVTHSVQCTVSVNKTAIVLVANPKTVSSGEESNLGWVTSGMDSCVISSPDDDDFTEENADITNVSGTANTGALTSTTRYALTCETKGDVVRTATTTVVVQ